MGDVQIAAVYDGLFLIQRADVGEKSVLPLHAVVEAHQTVARIRHIDRYEIIVGEFKSYHSALAVVLGDAEIVAHGQGRAAGEYRRAGVALALGVIPILMIAVELQLDLTGLHLCLLQAKYIGVELCEALIEILAEAGSDAVYIP